MGRTYGVFNRILHINLSDAKTASIELPLEAWRKYVGGKTLGAFLLNHRALFEKEPLSEESELMILVGPLTGSLGPGASKTIMFARSPLTGGYLDTTCGGSLAFQIKSCGYDGLIITGKSSSPVFIEIIDGSLRVRDAGKIWGMGCFEAEQTLRGTYGSGPAVVLIGPAGENLVKYACVHTDFYHQSGRGGAGAIMGSKNLKGLVISGNLPVPFFRQRELIEKQFQIIRETKDKQKVKFRAAYGTLSTLDLMQRLGGTVSRNFTDGMSDRYDEGLNREVIKESYGQRNLACFGCAVPCGNGLCFEFEGRPCILGGPEYEAMSLVGTNLDLSASQLLYMNWLMDDLGMDIISAGVTLSCVTEAVEKGRLKGDDLGFNLSWGGFEEAVKATKAIAHRRGSGDIMAEGVRRAAESLGLDADTAIHVKGMELPGYDPRGSIGYALEYAVADRGGCHRRARPLLKEQNDDVYRFSYEGKAELVLSLENERAFYHSLIICDFLPGITGKKQDVYAELLNLATGWDLDADGALRVGERGMNLSRLFNIRCGFRKEDDRLPGRFFKEKLPRGGSVGQILDKDKFKKMLSEYYALRGWDQEGNPTPEKLNELGINDLTMKG